MFELLIKCKWFGIIAYIKSNLAYYSWGDFCVKELLGCVFAFCESVYSFYQEKSKDLDSIKQISTNTELIDRICRMRQLFNSN